MKKYIYIPVVAGALAFGGIVWANSDDNPNETKTGAQGTAVPAVSNERMLSFDEASAKALAIANGTITDVELDRESRTPHYEIDIDHEGYEYDVKIDAFSGEVLEQKREKEDRDDSQDDGREDSRDDSQAAEGNFISSEEAVKAAQAVAKGTVKEVEFEDDDGTAHYEVKIEDGRTEHEIYVNAADGTILKQEQDDDKDDDDRDDQDDSDDRDDRDDSDDRDED